MPGTVLGSGDNAVIKTHMGPILRELMLYVGKPTANSVSKRQKMISSMKNSKAR